MKLDLLKELEGAEKIGISGHVKPDGDCVSSCLAMYKYISNAMPNAKLTVFLEPVPDCFEFMPNYDKIDNSFVGINDFDVYIALDSGSLDRIGKAEPFFRRAKKTICMDHHQSNPGYGDICVVDGECSSASELIYRYMDKKYVDDDIATCIYTGIIHDTGVLQYSNTKKETYLTVAELVEYNVNMAKIVEESFYQKTYKQNQLLGRVLTESIMFMDGRCIAGLVTQKMFKFYDADSRDLEGIVSQLRVTKGVDVAVFLYEIKSQEYKVSMRSSEKVDVSKIAVAFGGGGHARAAGCTLTGTYHDVLNNVSALIAEQLEMEYA